MIFISSFSDFGLLTEATLDDTKVGINYSISRPGRVSADRIGITDNMKLIYTTKSPKKGDNVLWIRSTTLTPVKFSELRTWYPNNDFMFYQTSSKKYPYAVALKGIKTNIIRQTDKVGAVKRSDHFRESAFMITFSIEAWLQTGLRIPIITNRGPVKMEYTKNKAFISNEERGEFRKEYEHYMSSNPKIANAMREQATELIEYLSYKNRIEKISYLVKNSSDLLINKRALEFIKDEIKFSQEGNSEFNLPSRVSISKWNPSDIWIVFEGYEWVMVDDEYESHEISNIDDLNYFLSDSLCKLNGSVGVSLKQSEDGGKLSIVNVGVNKVQHKYFGYDINNSKKTCTIKFGYRFGRHKSYIEGGLIDLRTFDTSNTSGVSFEVKGSKLAKHMSGKAASLIESLLPIDVLDAKNLVKDNTSKRVISNELEYKFHNSDIKEAFDVDLQSIGIKTQDQNSRMQSAIILDWLDNLSSSAANSVISQIVRFAKSESEWSAPHLLLK